MNVHHNSTGRDKLYVAKRTLRLRRSSHAKTSASGVIESGCYVRILELCGRRAMLDCGSRAGWAHISDRLRLECYLEPPPDGWKDVKNDETQFNFDADSELLISTQADAEYGFYKNDVLFYQGGERSKMRTKTNPFLVNRHKSPRTITTGASMIDDVLLLC